MITACSCLSRFLQIGLSFELVAFLQAGLLAFNPVGGFVNHRMKLIDVAFEEIAGIAFFPSGGCFPRATDCEVEVFESAGGLAFPDGRGDGSLTMSMTNMEKTRKPRVPSRTPILHR